MPTPTSTSTIQTVADALAGHPDTTAAELASATGLGRSTVSKALAILEAQQKASRHGGGWDGSRRLADRWKLLTDNPSAPPTGEGSDAEKPAAADEITPTPSHTSVSHGVAEKTAEKPAAHGQPQADTTDTAHLVQASTRLGKSQLRALVLAHLHAHPHQETSPTLVAKTLGRSAGAVGNALDKLAAEGAIIQTSTAPRRFAYQPD
jgi:DNA-binding MarR family transcriptional regulator